MSKINRSKIGEAILEELEQGYAPKYWGGEHIRAFNFTMRELRKLIKSRIRELENENKKLEDTGDGDSLSVLYKKDAKDMKVQLKLNVTLNNAKIQELKELLGED